MPETVSETCGPDELLSPAAAKQFISQTKVITVVIEMIMRFILMTSKSPQIYLRVV
jgi:hypothetical protein